MARRGRPPGRTERGEATRRALYDAATTLFAENGFEQTTMRDIADAAGVSPGLLYRYFPSKVAVVLDLYEALSMQWVTTTARQQPGSWTERFHAALVASLHTLGPHRRTLSAVMPILLADRENGLLSRNAWASRDRVRSGFVASVVESDLPPPHAEAVGRLGYLLQLAVLLWWVLDRSEDQQATHQLVALTGSWLPRLSLALWVPGAATVLTQLDALATWALYDDP